MQISLKAARVNANYTQREVADKIGVNRTSVWKWETGRTRISGDDLIKLCKLYGISVDDIFLPTKSAISWYLIREERE